MKKVPILSAVSEAATGVTLLIAPSLVVRLLFGEEATGVAIPLARVTGLALIALGVACWPHRDTLRAFQAAHAGLSVLFVWMRWKERQTEMSTAMKRWAAHAVDRILRALVNWILQLM
jgi:hypothetical protein